MTTTDAELIPADVLAAACQRLRVLTHPHRLQICDLLLHGDLSVGELAQRLRLRHNVVSQHLNHLRAHGVVRPRREGRTVYYQVVHPSAAWLLDCIRRNQRDVSAGGRVGVDD